MMVIAGNVLLVLALLYACVGLAVGVRFASVVAAGFNDRAAIGSFPFRMMLIPGAALLWPLVLRVGSRGVQSPAPRGPAGMPHGAGTQQNGGKPDGGPKDGAR